MVAPRRRLSRLVVLSCLVGGGAAALSVHSLAAPPTPELTLAVLPFEKGAGSEELAGLGSTFAGLVLADLDEVEGLRLVERERVDAILAEAELGQSGLLDPALATKVGKGVGAQLLVVGTWSVVKERLALAARVVDVETGDVRHATSSSGALDEFVEVQKELSLGLLEKIGRAPSRKEARALQGNAPTERFDALVAFARGDDAKARGKPEEARRAFAEAVLRDPAFESAGRALREMERLLEAFEGERSEGEGRLWASAQRRLEQEVAGFRVGEGPPTQDEVVDLLVRWIVLENGGRDCQRYGEMIAYLDRVGWRVKEPPRPRGSGTGVLSWRFGKRAKELGLEVAPSRTPAPEVAHVSLHERGPRLMKSTGAFLLHPGLQLWKVGKWSSSLVGVAARCHRGQALLDEISAMQARVREAGGADELLGNPGSSLSLDDWLELAWITLHARELGPGPAMTARAERLLQRVGPWQPGASKESEMRRRVVTKHLDDAQQWARSHEEERLARLGLPWEVIDSVVDAVAAGDRSILVRDADVCRLVFEERAEDARGFAEKRERSARAPRHGARALGAPTARIFAPLRDFGCLAGTPALFDTPESVLDGTERALAAPPPSLELPGCPESREAVQRLLTDLRRVPPAPEQAAKLALGWSEHYHRLVVGGCVPPLR